MTYVELRNAISEINDDVWCRVKSADDGAEEIDGLIHDYVEARVRGSLEGAALAIETHKGLLTEQECIEIIRAMTPK